MLDCWAALVTFRDEYDNAFVGSFAVSPCRVRLGHGLLGRLSVLCHHTMMFGPLFSVPLQSTAIHAPLTSVIKVSAAEAEHEGLGGEPHARLS